MLEQKRQAVRVAQLEGLVRDGINVGSGFDDNRQAPGVFLFGGHHRGPGCVGSTFDQAGHGRITVFQGRHEQRTFKVGAAVSQEFYALGIKVLSSDNCGGSEVGTVTGQAVDCLGTRLCGSNVKGRIKISPVVDQ